MTPQEFIQSVPKRISLMGDTYTISFVDKVDLDMDFVFGLSDFANREIFIAKFDRKGRQLPVSVMETTLYHEISHIILDSGQYLELSAQEFLVEWLGRSMKDVVKAFTPRISKSNESNECTKSKRVSSKSKSNKSK